MDKKQSLIFGVLVFVGTIIWGPVVSGLATAWLSDAGALQIYLFNKLPFALLLLAVMGSYGGLKFYGLHRGSSWWFLVQRNEIH